MNDKTFIERLERIIQKRKQSKRSELLYDVVCELCGTKIHIYTGPVDGILCSDCYEPNPERIGCGSPWPIHSMAQDNKGYDGDTI